jgi:signal transduction histidine kinase
MTSSSSIHTPEAWTPYLRWAFPLIIGGFVLSIGIAIFDMWNTQTKMQLIQKRALASIQLTARLAQDIERERLLVDAHIVESQLAGMERIEKELAAAEARITATLSAYEPTIADDVELAAWQNVQQQIAVLQSKAKEALDFSRQHLEGQARSALSAIAREYDALDQGLDGLTRLNVDRAGLQLASIRAFQRISVIILTLLTLAWTAIAFILAKWVTTLTAQRESQMRATTLGLEQRNRELDAFAGRVAHDLRGPLTAINLAASTTNEGLTRNSSGVFRRGVRQMEAIIEDLLALSRISAETIKAICQTSHVSASVEADLRPTVEAVGGTLRVEAADAAVPYSAGLLRQALWNLGDNAVKYRRPGVQLEIGIRGQITGDAYEFTVSDNGKGMSAVEGQHAFDPFFRGEHVRSMSGTGLGLSIVKRVVEASGGSVSVHSIAGQGSTFKIRLPLATRKAA